jgi:DNA repair exonuclease SbcCD ATPase subunit
MFMSLRAEAKSKLFVESLNLDRWVHAADRASASAKQVEREQNANSRDLVGCEAAFAENRDQYDKACDLEKEFEAELEKEIADTRKLLFSAEDASSAALTVLDDARYELAKIDAVDEMRLHNDRRLSLRRLLSERSGIDASITVLLRDHRRITSNREQYVLNTCPECGQIIEVAEVEKKLVVIDDEINQLNTDRVKLESARKGIEASIKQVESFIEESEKSLADFKAVQAKVALCAEKSLSADREKHRITALLDQVKNKPNPFTKQCDDLIDRIKDYKARIKKLKTLIQQKDSDIAVYRFWEQGFREIRFKLIDEVLLELEMVSMRYAEMLGLQGWQIRFQTEHETSKGDTAYEFSVLLYPPDDNEPVDWETYCGGEVQRWQLCTTFGLADVLLARAGLEADFEIIDEPTTHLSPSGIEDLLTCLSDRARDTGKRIFLIDHNSLDRGIFDGVVSIVKDKKRGTYIADTGGVIELREKTRRVRL